MTAQDLIDICRAEDIDPASLHLKAMVDGRVFDVYAMDADDSRSLVDPTTTLLLVLSPSGSAPGCP